MSSFTLSTSPENKVYISESSEFTDNCLHIEGNIGTVTTGHNRILVTNEGSLFEASVYVPEGTKFSFINMDSNIIPVFEGIVSRFVDVTERVQKTFFDTLPEPLYSDFTNEINKKHSKRSSLTLFQ